MTKEKNQRGDDKPQDQDVVKEESHVKRILKKVEHKIGRGKSEDSKYMSFEIRDTQPPPKPPKEQDDKDQ